MRTVAHLLTHRPGKYFVHALLLCAMRDETRHVAQQLVADRFTVAPNGRLFRGNVIVDVRTIGIGTAHAAANASLHIERLAPDVVVNVGCAGAHREELRLGDVVVATSCVPSAHVVWKSDRIVHYGDRDAARHHLESDPTLVAMAAHSTAELAAWGEGGDAPEVHAGRVASSDVWLDDREVVERARGLFDSSCEDMEAAAVATVARHHGLPFVAIKDISNSVYKPSAESFDSVAHRVPDLAGRNAAAVAARLCRDLSDMTD